MGNISSYRWLIYWFDVGSQESLYSHFWSNYKLHIRRQMVRVSVLVIGDLGCVQSFLDLNHAGQESHLVIELTSPYQYSSQGSSLLSSLLQLDVIVTNQYPDNNNINSVS